MKIKRNSTTSQRGRKGQDEDKGWLSLLSRVTLWIPIYIDDFVKPAGASKQPNDAQMVHGVLWSWTNKFPFYVTWPPYRLSRTGPGQEGLKFWWREPQLFLVQVLVLQSRSRLFLDKIHLPTNQRPFQKAARLSPCLKTWLNLALTRTLISRSKPSWLAC
jgi:hypothetical protein